MAAHLAIALCVLGQPAPASRVPPDLAAALVSGDTRVLVVGDSISSNISGDASGANHTPLTAGMQRQWRPDAWRGIYVPPAYSTPGGYNTVRGVGASCYDIADSIESVIAMETNSMIDGAGFERCFIATYTGSVNIFAPRGEYRMYPASHPSGNAASSQLLSSPTLMLRHLVHSSLAGPTVPGIRLRYTTQSYALWSDAAAQPVAGDGWVALDFPAARPPGSAATDALIAQTYLSGAPSPGASYITAGSLFYDRDAHGLQVVSIAQGGWNTADHLHTTPGLGYSDQAVRAAVRIFGLADEDVTPVVIIATGANTASGESANGVATELYRDHIAALAQRYRGALAAEGVFDAWFVYVVMYSFDMGPAPDMYGASRAERIWEVAGADPRSGYFNLVAMMGEVGSGFDPAWYFAHPSDLHLSRAGAEAVADAMWAVIEDAAVCGSADFDGDGDTGTDNDIEAFFACLGGNCCAACGAPDFDQDGDTGTDADIEAFFRVLGGGC